MYEESAKMASMAESGVITAQTYPSGATARALPARWSLTARVAFRFAFTYLILYCLPFSGRVSLLDALPVGGDAIQQILERPWRALCPWVAVHVFHLSGPVTKYHPTGSGDTTLDYIQVFCLLFIAAVVTLVWSLADYRRTQYCALNSWLRLLVRFTVAFTLLGYGFAKLFPLQFPAPDFSRLTETYGESSPMGLLWAFMGASPIYEMFCGSMEITAGLLLLFRKTSTLGALWAAAVMLNIVMMNFCFDVPVKLYSSHLLLMMLFLLIPDMRPLWHFFVLRRISKLEGVWIPRFGRRWLRATAIVIQVLVIGSILFQNLRGGYEGIKTGKEAGFQSLPLYGIWDVDSSTGVSSNGASLDKDIQWRRLLVDHNWGVSGVSVRTSDDRLLRFIMNLENAKSVFKLQGWQNDHQAEFSYRRIDEQHLVLTGSFDKQPVQVNLHHRDPQHFLLTTRGFHWISEDPYNL